MGNLLLPIATAWGAWGGFPKAPWWFSRYVQTSVVWQYLCMWILIYQGGGNSSVGVTTLATLLVWGVLAVSERTDPLKQQLG